MTKDTNYKKTVEEVKFLETAIYIHEHCNNQEEFMHNKELWNLMGTYCYNYFNIALNYSTTARWILKSPLDKDDVLNECVVHYMTKFYQLWENSSNEYYMKSVMFQLKNRVRDVAARPFIQDYPNKDDISDFVEEVLLCDENFKIKVAEAFLKTVSKRGRLKKNALLPNAEDMVSLIVNQKSKYIAVTAVNNLIQECIKKAVDKNSVSMEEAGDYLSANDNVEETATMRFEATKILTLSYKCTKFEIVSFYGTKVLGIKNCDISNAIYKYGFEHTSKMILKMVAEVFEIEYNTFFSHFTSEKCVEYVGVEDLSDKISKKSCYCEAKLAKLAGVARKTKTRCKVK